MEISLSLVVILRKGVLLRSLSGLLHTILPSAAVGRVHQLVRAVAEGHGAAGAAAADERGCDSDREHPQVGRPQDGTWKVNGCRGASTAVSTDC